MREPIKVEFMHPEDQAQMAEWIAANSARNDVDPNIFCYPATRVLKASNGKPLVYMPVQNVQMLESLGINPEANAAEVSLALKDLLQVIEWEGRKAGHGEILFLTSDKSTKRFAGNHGLEKVEGFTLFRRRIV